MNRRRQPAWPPLLRRSVTALARGAFASGAHAMERMLKSVPLPVRAPPAGPGAWTPGAVIGKHGARRFRLYCPPDVLPRERLPLMVMLHGCQQDAQAMADASRMNRIARRERFFVLYPEQDRLANSHGCWNWFDLRGGRAHAEAALIVQAIDQVSLFHAVDPRRIAVAGLSAGASMAALIATMHPERFAAVVMHSGVPPGVAHSTISALDAMRGRATPPPIAPAFDADAPALLVIHGDRDTVVSPRNALGAVHAWAAAAGAKRAPARRVQRGARHPTTVTDYRRRGALIARLVEVEGLGHAWSGGPRERPYCDPGGPDAARMAWTFAAQQFAARGASSMPAEAASRLSA